MNIQNAFFRYSVSIHHMIFNWLLIEWHDDSTLIQKACIIWLVAVFKLLNNKKSKYICKIVSIHYTNDRWIIVKWLFWSLNTLSKNINEMIVLCIQIVDFMNIQNVFLKNSASIPQMIVDYSLIDCNEPSKLNQKVCVKWLFLFLELLFFWAFKIHFSNSQCLFCKWLLNDY